MNGENRLANFSLWLIAAAVVGFTVIGLALFIAPAWAAVNFPWKISPFVAMTMGGWYLGSAVMAGLAAVYRRWGSVYANVIFTGIFALAETLVLLVHYAKIRFDALLAWPYIVMLALGLLAGLGCLVDWLRHRPGLADDGAPVTRWVRGVIVGFCVFVFFLSLVAFSGHWVGLEGVIFPEPLTSFTLHAFGAFYFSLAFASIFLLRAHTLSPITVVVQGGLALIVFITLAALVYLPVFDFGAHPFQSIYLIVYIGVGAAAAVYLWWAGRRRRPAS